MFDEPRRRKPLRLPDRDYSRPGTYFITVCSYKKEETFGRVANGVIRLSTIGEVVERELRQVPQWALNIRVDEFVVMPNYLHAILVFAETPDGSISLPELVRQYKFRVTKHIQTLDGDRECKIWHRSYNERVIRNAIELHNIRAYIRANPECWEDDEFGPRRLRE